MNTPRRDAENQPLLPEVGEKRVSDAAAPRCRTTPLSR